MSTTLPRDMARCKDHSCEKRNNCRRFLQRHDKNAMNFVKTLRSKGYECFHFIKERQT